MDVKHEDARILREALAHVANYGSMQIKLRALNTLREYGRRVEPYCDHPEVVTLDGVAACLDCGRRGIRKKRGAD